MQRIIREAAIPLIIASSIGASWLVSDVTRRAVSLHHPLERIINETEPRTNPSPNEYLQAAPTNPIPEPARAVPAPSLAQPPQQPLEEIVSEPEPQMLPPIVEYPRNEPVREPVEPAQAAPVRPPAVRSEPQPQQSAPVQPPTQQPIPVQPPQPTPQPREPPPVQAPLREPASQLEGIITAWQAATISRFTVIEPLVTEIAREFNVPQATIYGIILSESSAYPDALSGDGKRGLLQYDDHVFSAIIDLNAYNHEAISDHRLTRHAYDPETSLRAYRIQLRAYREYTDLSDPVDIHIVRGADHDVHDISRYLATPAAREHRERIERRIREAENILRFTHASNEYRALGAGSGSIRQRLEAQLGTMIGLAGETRGDYRNAYATNAVSYARILGSDLAHEAIEHVREENPTRAQALETRLRAPLR